MSRVSKSEQHLRKLSSQISTLTDLPYNVVKTVLDTFYLLLLNEIRNQGIDDILKNSKYNNIEVDIPNIGKIALLPTKWNRDDSIFGGQAFRVKFYIDDNFLYRCRNSYYCYHDYVTDSLSDNFPGQFSKYYSSMLSKYIEGYDPNMSDDDIELLKKMTDENRKLSPTERFDKLKSKLESIIEDSYSEKCYLTNIKMDFDIQSLVVTDKEIYDATISSDKIILGKDKRGGRIYITKRDPEIIKRYQDKGDKLYFTEEDNDGF